MELAKPALDVGLYTNNIEAQLAFWQKQAQVPFTELLKVGGGVHQHRHAIGDSVLKINSVRDPLAQAAASGLRRLQIAADYLVAPQALTDPDGNSLILQPTSGAVGQLRVDLTVSNLNQHQDFYGGICGFRDLGDDVFAVGASQIALHEGAAHRDPEQRALGLRYLTVQVFDVKAEHQRVIALGGREGTPPVKLGEVAHISFIRDPDGNWIEISQRKSITGSLD